MNRLLAESEIKSSDFRKLLTKSSRMNPDIIVDEPISMNMAPYAGAWTRAEAAHLLRRTMLGFNFQHLSDAVSNGMNTTVSTLLTLNSVSPPLTYDADESIASQGQTWVNSVYPTGDTNPTHGARSRSLGAWMMQRIELS